ncbi:MAG TPA: hypothetical protein ENG45_02025, partial [Candidatus Aenigmarchaeota archaeon]|nr:hypothetical protein [Candidatus Aenigmarchaeota archaeon]
MKKQGVKKMLRGSLYRKFIVKPREERFKRRFEMQTVKSLVLGNETIVLKLTRQDVSNLLFLLEEFLRGARGMEIHPQWFVLREILKKSLTHADENNGASWRNSESMCEQN